MIISQEISRRLMAWFGKNHREMPWRETTDPYCIWLSEIMLQQTQVATVIPYYERWLQRFPDVKSLASADLQDVLKSWEGLGYYTRARNFKKGAEYIIENPDSSVNDPFPKDESGWLDVPGVGPYTAAAVSSIAFEYPAGVVDGNVIRVISRLFALDENSTTAPFKRKIKALVETSFRDEHPGWVNQAWMEFGALQCTPNPDCDTCVLKLNCKAFAAGDVTRFPVKPKKKKIPLRKGRAYLIERDGKYLMCRRPTDHFLGGLWEFPNDFCGGSHVTADNKDLGRLRILRETGITVKHVYSHFRQELMLVEAEAPPAWSSSCWQDSGWVAPEDLAQFARPAIQIKIEGQLQKKAR